MYRSLRALGQLARVPRLPFRTERVGGSLLVPTRALTHSAHAQDHPPRLHVCVRRQAHFGQMSTEI